MKNHLYTKLDVNMQALVTEIVSALHLALLKINIDSLF